jgi:transposase
LSGILFVLYTGIAWRHLPLELGFGSGATGRRGLDEWQAVGVWDRLHELLLARLQQAGEIEWSRAMVVGSHIEAKQGGPETGPSPVERGRAGSKHHLLVDATGIPLAFSVTGGNRNDVTQLIPLLDKVPPVRGAVGRPRQRPDTVVCDRGYDHDKHRRLVRDRGIKPVIARRQTEHGSRLGTVRWVVERTFAWLHNFKRLLVRYDRRHEIHHPSSRSAAASSADADWTTHVIHVLRGGCDIGSLWLTLLSKASERDTRPDRLHDAEGPCAREEAVDAGQGTSAGEGEHEPVAALLKRVHQHHERDRCGSEQGQRVHGLLPGRAFMEPLRYIPA